jgi:hypothetical protein
LVLVLLVLLVLVLLVLVLLLRLLLLPAFAWAHSIPAPPLRHQMPLRALSCCCHHRKHLAQALQTMLFQPVFVQALPAVPAIQLGTPAEVQLPSAACAAAAFWGRPSSLVDQTNSPEILPWQPMPVYYLRRSLP